MEIKEEAIIRSYSDFKEAIGKIVQTNDEAVVIVLRKALSEKLKTFEVIESLVDDAAFNLEEFESLLSHANMSTLISCQYQHYQGLQFWIHSNEVDINELRECLQQKEVSPLDHIIWKLAHKYASARLDSPEQLTFNVASALKELCHTIQLLQSGNIAITTKRLSEITPMPVALEDTPLGNWGDPLSIQDCSPNDEQQLEMDIELALRLSQQALSTSSEKEKEKEVDKGEGKDGPGNNGQQSWHDSNHVQSLYREQQKWMRQATLETNELHLGDVDLPMNEEAAIEYAIQASLRN
jgi:hypothetical protein